MLIFFSPERVFAVFNFILITSRGFRVSRSVLEDAHRVSEEYLRCVYELFVTKSWSASSERYIRFQAYLRVVLGLHVAVYRVVVASNLWEQDCVLAEAVGSGGVSAFSLEPGRVNMRWTERSDVCELARCLNGIKCWHNLKARNRFLGSTEVTIWGKQEENEPESVKFFQSIVWGEEGFSLCMVSMLCSISLHTTDCADKK